MSDSYIQAVEKNIDAAGERTDEITRLREENARLREENDAWQMDGGSCAEEVKRLREENARLRETLQYIADPYRTTSKDRLAFLARAAIREEGKEG